MKKPTIEQRLTALEKRMDNIYNGVYSYTVDIHPTDIPKDEGKGYTSGSPAYGYTKPSKKGSYWMINTRGMIRHSPKSGKKYEDRKEFGDVFDSKKKAETALKRIKAVFKRINKL